MINDEYARDTSVKIKSALNGKKKKGEFIGAFASYGYIKNSEDKHKLEIDEKAAEIVRKIFDWNVNKGLGKIAICHRLNNLGILNPTGHKKLELKQNYNNFGNKENKYNWTPSTIRRILENEIYIGNTVQGKRRAKSYKIHKVESVPKEEWIRVENTHKPIIDKEIFWKAQELKEVDTRVQKNQKLSVWAGILRCGDCKMAMNKKYCKNKNGKVYEYYICGTYRKKSKNLCTKHTIKLDELENAVLQVLKDNISSLIDFEELFKEFDKFTIKRLPNEIDKNFKNDKINEIKRLENLKRILYEDWKNEDITKAKNIIENLKIQKEENNKIENENNNWIESFRLQKNIFNLDREILLELVDYIEIFENKKIKIYFKFTNIN